MFTTLLAYLPIVVAPLLAVGLAAVLQHWVESAAAPLPAAGASVVATTPDASPPKPTWSDIATRANPLVAYVLPILTSAAIVLLGLWPFAYLGWAVIELDPDPGWSAQVPPWFGNLGYFLGFGIAGLFIAIIGGLVAFALGFVLHALGKCILWPALCACFDEYADADDDDDGDAGDNAADDDPDEED